MTGGGGSRSQKPRAVIHKNILDVADENPEASLDKIADEVPGATVDLVDRVLDEYGDPSVAKPSVATQENGTSPEEVTTETTSLVNGKTMTKIDGGNVTKEEGAEKKKLRSSPPEMKEKQRTTLRKVYENPGASQSDIGEMLDVTAATINNRLNSIPGFEWEERESFAASVFEDTGSVTEPQTTDTTEAGDESAGNQKTETPSRERPVDQSLLAKLERLDDRLATLETELAALDSETKMCIEPKLAHKVVHAAMETDYISEEEELQLLRELMN